MFEGNPDNSSFSKGQSQAGAKVSPIRDSEVMAILTGIGVDSPIIFSLIWGYEMGATKNQLFPVALKETVQSIQEHVEKRDTAYDAAEVKLHGIIIDLLQVVYEKQVNNIVDISLKGGR